MRTFLFCVVMIVFGLKSNAAVPLPRQFNAKVHHVKFANDGRPYITNLSHAVGWRHQDRFLFEFSPSTDEFELETKCGWDGESLRWYSVLNGGTGPFSANQLTTNRFFRAYLDVSPVPRSAARSAQGLSFALLTSNTLALVANDSTNRILLDAKSHIPDSYSTITIAYFPSSSIVSQIVSRAPNFVWAVKGERKEKTYLPALFTNGFTHWIFSAEELDSKTSWVTKFSFKTFFYNMKAIDSEELGKETLLMNEVRGEIEYGSEQSGPDQWSPPLPVDRSKILDIRDSPSKESFPNVIGIAGPVRDATNRQWGADLSSTRADLLTSEYVYRETNSPSYAGRKNAFRIIGAIVLLLPFVFLWRKRAKNK